MLSSARRCFPAAGLVIRGQRGPGPELEPEPEPERGFTPERLAAHICFGCILLIFTRFVPQGVSRRVARVEHGIWKVVPDVISVPTCR